jgi:hypothetical protein
VQGQYFYTIGDRKLGPVPLAELQRLAAAGTVTPQTLVWTEGMPQWVPAMTLPAVRGGVADTNSVGMNLLLPIGPQSGFAIAAGYLGLFGLVLPLLGELGIVFGALGLRDVKAHPEKRGTGRAVTGIVCGGIGSLLWLFIVMH